VKSTKAILQSHITTEAFGDYAKLLILLSNIVVTGFLGEITGAGVRDVVRLQVVENKLLLASTATISGSALWMLCVHRHESLDAVVAADTALCRVGAAEGLPVTNPEGPS